MYLQKKWMKIWGFSSAGRAPALQAGGQRFDPANLHQDSKEDKRLTEVPWKQDASLSFLKLKYVPWKLNIDDYDAIMRRQHKGKFLIG